MTANTPAKRRRGGQPGNRNAKGNRGNPNPRRNFGNKGGGAPFGNQNARKKRPAPPAVMLRDYRHDPEMVAWIQANAEALKDANFTADDDRDRALYSGYCGLTPEALAAGGQEYRLGLYVTMSEVEFDEEDPAA